MLDNKTAFTKKKAVKIVVSVAVVLVLLVLLRYLFPVGSINLSTSEGRESFLLKLGWEVDMQSETYRSVVVPSTLEGTLKDYNEMQLAQGYDLNKHLGEKCEQYTYVVTNYPNYDKTVFVTIYVQGRDIVAGDIHTAAADGFMHGLKLE